MKRRHVLALVILALVVATVLAVGPGRVWDALTLRTVAERHWPNGNPKLRVRYRLWERDSGGGLDGEAIYHYVDTWHENGQKKTEIRRYPSFVREWDEHGRLVTYLRDGDGVYHSGSEQYLKANGRIVERRPAPRWFTEDEILQSVEGVEE